MRGAMNDDSKEAYSYLSREEVAGLDPYGRHKREEEQAQEQARGQRVTTESNKDIEAPKLNAPVEGLGFFRFQLESGQLRPTIAAHPTQESLRSRGFLDWIILVLRILTAICFIAAVVFAIWHLVLGEQTPPIVSTSFEIFGISFIGSLLALGGFTLISLQIRLNKMARQIDANQRTERKQRPEIVIREPQKPLRATASDQTIKDRLKALKDNDSDENLLIEWTKTCLEDEEIKGTIEKEIGNLKAKHQRIVEIRPDRDGYGISLTFVTEYRIPV
jgi:hypothetical protein